MRYKRNGIINNMINKKKTLLIILSIIMILPISFIIANMSEAALSYSVRRGDILIGAFVVLICILIRFGIDRVIVRLMEEEREKESKEEAEVEIEVDASVEVVEEVDAAGKVATDNVVDEIEELDPEADSDIDSEEEIEDYDEKEESIIGSLFKNIIIYVIAATLLVGILFLYSIEWISLVLALTGIIFLSIVLLEKNIYRKRYVVYQAIESEELDDNIEDDLVEESDDKLAGEEKSDDADKDTQTEGLDNTEKLVEAEKTDNTEKLVETNKTNEDDEVNDSEKADKSIDSGESTENTEISAESENKAETKTAEDTDNSEKTTRKNKKNKRKRNRNVADRIKRIKDEEKIIQLNDDIELTFAEPKETVDSEKPSDAELNNKENNKQEKDTKENKVERNSENVEKEVKQEEKEDKREEKKEEKIEKQIKEQKEDNKEEKNETEVIETEVNQDKDEDTDKDETVEELDSDNTDESEKKEGHVGKIVFTAILKTIAYLLPMILVLLVFGDLQAKHFTGPYFMLIIVLSILAAGIEVVANNMPASKVSYIITSIFLTVFLCHRSVLIGLVFLLGAYLILVIVPIVYDNWGTGGTKAVNRAKISMSRLVSRVFTLIMMLLAIWKLSYGAMWEIDYLVLLSVSVCSIGYMADRQS